MQIWWHWCAAGVVAVAAVSADPAKAQPPRLPGGTAAAVPGGEGLWVSAFPLDEGRHMLLIVDPVRRHAAVYHVDAAAGTLTLKSTRDISWDLMVGDFNALDPKPSALKKMLEVGRPPAGPEGNRP